MFTTNSSHHVLSTITSSSNFASLTAFLLTDIEEVFFFLFGKVIKKVVSVLQQESSIPLGWNVLGNIREHVPEI